MWQRIECGLRLDGLKERLQSLPSLPFKRKGSRTYTTWGNYHGVYKEELGGQLWDLHTADCLLYETFVISDCPGEWQVDVLFFVYKSDISLSLLNNTY